MDEKHCNGSLSALEENIGNKGKHSYYYAHSHKATGPKWDGKPQPRLLSKNNSPEDCYNSKTSFDTNNSSITVYSFSDENSKIKIYIPLAVSSADDVTLKHDCESFALTATDINFEKKRLAFNKLFGTVEENGKVKVKSDKIIVTFTKKEEKDWPRLGF
mmetsp:Transcript_3534/g.3909  ORF Transcript_3534/g.3909 Transcript_3534/m.3909 type:complete len:159 (-) Transcript_3534:797-1273(-)